jgi:hypothetical protein
MCRKDGDGWLSGEQYGISHAVPLVILVILHPATIYPMYTLYESFDETCMYFRFR